MGISTFLRLLLLYILPYCVSSSLHDLPIDASFDFGSSLEGWAEDGTSIETELIARVEAGELRASLLDRHPVLDSPFVALNITPIHFVVLRMKYTGTPALGRLLFLTPDISSNSSSSSLFVSESFLDIPWVARQPPSVVSSAASLSNHPASNVVDGDLTTYFESSITSGAFIIFDLKDYRSVDQINLLSPANTTSPRRCLLQRSLTSGVGPFTTVTSFTLSNTSTSFQTISGFVSSSARYWQLLLLDNYGGSSIVLNEVSFGGSDAAIHSISYPIYNDENYHMYYIPLSSLFPSSSSFLPISRLRLAFLYDPTLISATADIAIDYIRLIRAPVIERVTGCLDKYRFEEPLTSPAFFNVTLVENPVNTNIIIRSFVKNMMDLQYAQTFDCPLQGGIPLLIQGYNFGRASLVDINGAECQVLSRQVSASNGRYESIICTLPPGHAGPAGVTVRNGFNVNVSTTVPALYYRVPTLPPVSIEAMDIGAIRIDLQWSPPPEDIFSELSITGYRIRWSEFPLVTGARIEELFVSNVTYTSIRGLSPNTSYVFTISTLCEGAFPSSAANLPTDLYGARDPVEGFVVGDASNWTSPITTLSYDINFLFFDVQTLLSTNYTSSGNTSANTLTPLVINYGLSLVGSANIQNCNASSTCCDGFDATQGALMSCASNSISVCSVPSFSASRTFKYNGSMILLQSLPDFVSNFTSSSLPNVACGYAIRLTPSEARQSGAMWYRRKQNVGEGFDTIFTIQMSNPSQVCASMDDVNTLCRYRGADGMAFVIHNAAEIGPVDIGSLGTGGRGLGYEGIANGLVIEFDTHFNYDALDHYDNHISVITRGWRHNLSANHTFALASTSRIPDLTNGPRTIRIRYSLTWNEEDVFHPSFMTLEQSTYFFTNADYHHGSGQGDWGAGVGLLYVYVDDLDYPVLITMLNIEDTLHLDNGRAFVGFTAGTGDNNWQAHDVLSWQFRSLWQNRPYTRPSVVNGEGAFECINEEKCVHRPDLDHYYRSNRLVEGSAVDTFADFISDF